MLKERIQEVFDFTKSESPYRKANKGWINQDIFLDLSPSINKFKQKDEDAKVTLFWTPINNLLFNIFIIIILCSVLVFTSASFAKGRLDFDLFNKSVILDIVEVEKNNSLETNELEDTDPANDSMQQNIDSKDLDESIQFNSLDEDLIKVDKKIDKQDSSTIESQSKKDIKILQNNKPKSNFI